MENLNQIEYSAENVEKIVSEFYTTSQVSNEFKPQLDQWLKQAQNSQEAWNFSWELIDMNKSAETQFYGATTLYHKVSKYFNEVPNDQYDILKNKLLEKLLLYATKNAQQQVRLIQRKLNATLAKLALYLIDDQWENCVSEVIQTIPNCINNVTVSQEEIDETKMQLIAIVLDLLTLLPEELATINLQRPKRSQINSKLRGNFSLIRDYLLNLFNEITNGGEKLANNNLNTSGTEGQKTGFFLIEIGIKCLNSWTEFGISFVDLQPFMDFLFISIYNDSLFETSAECLTSLFSSEETLKYTNTVFKYTPKILALTELLSTFVNNKDTDGSVVLTKLILAFGENQICTLFDGLLYGDDSTKQVLLQFIQLIMSLTSMPGNFPVDEESSDLTFVFWYTLQDTLLGMDGKFQSLMVIFQPFFVNLLEIFIIKLKLPSNYDDWSEDEKERLRCYRIDIGDTMVYMISLVGEMMLEFIIKRLVQSIEASSAEQSQNNDWKLQEALIYMLQSVVSELNESCSPEFSYNNDTFLSTFMEFLPRINYSNKHILSTTLLAVGSLGGWLDRNPQLLQNAISLSLLGLKTESVTQSASFALKDIINDCDLSQFSDQIIQTCIECLKLGTVAYNYEVRLMSIIGLCLSDLLCIDMARAQGWLDQIIEPYIIKLNELSQLKSVDKHQQVQTCHVLNLVSQLLSSIVQRQKTFHEDNTSNLTNSLSGSIMTGTNEEKAVVNAILIKLIPIYKQFIQRNLTSDLTIIDKLFESISVTLASSIPNNNPQEGNQSIEPYLNDLIEMFYALNENSWRKYAFETCRQILIIWWRNDKYKPVLHNLFVFSNQNAMKLIQKDMNWFHEHTDVVEQYCTCLAKLLKSKYYDLFEKLSMEELVYLLRFAQLGLQLPEQYTLRAVSTFIEEFVKFTKTKNHLVDFIEKNSIHLIQVVLIGISGALPRHLVDILAGIYYIFVKEYPQLTSSMLNSILIKADFQPFAPPPPNQQPGQQNTASFKSFLTKEQKTAFINSLFKESTNKRKFKEAVNEFSLLCRGLINTQYGKETSQKF